MPDQNQSTYQVYADQFRAGYELALQQKAAKFEPHVTMLKPIDGIGGTVANFVEPFEAEVGGDDLGDTEWSIPEFNTRWVFPIKIRSAVPVTTDDQLYTLEDPKNPLIEATYASHRRAMDRKIILPAMFRAVTGGKDKDKTFSFPAGHVVAKSIGGADTGLNWSKYVRVNQMFQELEVDLDDEAVTIGISPQQEAWALHMAETKNSDFMKLGITVENGRLRRFASWNVVVSNAIAKNTAGTSWLCPVWCKSGIGVQMWLNPKIRVSERPDKNYTTQIFAEMRAGAVRMQEGKILQLECHVANPTP